MPRKLPFSSKLGFGIGQTAEGVTLVVFGSYILFYYNQILQVPGSLTGLALALSLFFDAVTDPLAGSISDRLKSRWGRRHPLIALSAVPLAVCIIALFVPPSGMSTWFYFGWLVVFALAARLFLTLYHIPHMALGAEIAHDYVDRSRVFAYSQLFGTLGSAVFGFLALTYFFPTTPDSPHGMLNHAGYTPFALCAAVAVVVSIALFMMWTMKEIPYLPDAGFTVDERLSLRRVFRELMTAFGNRSFRLLFQGLILAVIMLGIEGTFMVYMYVHFWNLPTESMRWLGPVTIAALPFSIAMAPLLTSRFEKRWILITLSAIIIVNANVMICLRLFTDWLPPNGTTELFALLLFFQFIAGLASPAVMVTLNSMFADIADQQELRTGERQEGIIYSVRAFAFKSAGAIASVLGGIGLDLISFPRGAAPGTVPDDVLFWLGMGAGPVCSVLGLFILAFYIGYDLDRRRVEEIQRELANRRTQAGPAREPDALDLRTAAGESAG
jgi:GPH family glycoside/pentoside/hexuronide:cation symporter